MAALPVGVYNVVVNSGSNPSLSGALNTKTTPATYKGQTTTVTWDGVNSIIGWSYTAPGASEANVFSGGQYTPGTPPPPNAYNMGSFSSGTVTIPYQITESAPETWSASASGTGIGADGEDPKYAEA